MIQPYRLIISPQLCAYSDTSNRWGKTSQQATYSCNKGLEIQHSSLRKLRRGENETLDYRSLLHSQIYKETRKMDTLAILNNERLKTGVSSAI